MAGETGPLLRLAGVDVRYGRAQVLFGLGLELRQGEVLALLGRNGAGKSTTLKTVIGLLHPVGGTIAFAGRRIDGLAPQAVSRLGIGWVPEDRRIFTDLTVAENLAVARQPRRAGAPCWDEAALFRLFPPLAALRGRLGGRMSGGEQQMLTVARTLMGNPRLLLLDEPSEGLAPRVVADMAAAISRLKQEGLSVLLSEQNLHFAGRVADRAAIIEQGRIRHVAPMAELLADKAAQAAYLRA
jgi:branched-chain amino acid transport system ATP-binding protein